jgi:membrane-associated protease RseP (regulator of RpoE activity)
MKFSDAAEPSFGPSSYGPMAIEAPDPRLRRPRLFSKRFPIIMFLLTVASTVWVGILAWAPDMALQVLNPSAIHMVRRCILANWANGIQFSAALMTILLAHEFGHYCMMRYYSIRSTYPIFIPFPISPFGTCGAIIAMDPSAADRRQIFDIGIAGPLAGLAVAVPLAILGLLYPDGPPLPQPDSLRIGQPLAMYVLDYVLKTDLIVHANSTPMNTSSPFFMAAWFGFLITGLNMMPISQLDGGHVAFGIFGDKSEWIAKLTFGAVIVYLIVAKVYMFWLMLLLIYFIGLKHPPSSDDSRVIGWPRTVLGIITMTLPIWCIPANPIQP